MTGHLPMIFHPDARDVVNIGLGAGVTLGALSTYPVWTLDVVEIEPSAKRVAELFGAENHEIMNNRLMNFMVGDGRNHLFCTTNFYDVISSDPFEPVHAGANHLYTVEHFRQARTRLKPGGLMCQYVPLYELSNEDYMAILRSFAEVFPSSLLMFTGEDSLILGFPDEPKLDYATLQARFAVPSVKASLNGLGIDSVEVLIGMIVSDWRKTDVFHQPGPMNEDNLPFVEFSAPKSALKYTTFENQKVLLDSFTDLPDDLVASMPEEARAKVEAYRESLKNVLEANLYRDTDQDRMVNLLQTAYQRTPDHPAVINELVSVIEPSSSTLFNQGNLQAASDQTQFLLELDPGNFWGLHRMTTLAMMAGKVDYAGDILLHALTLYPQSGIMRALFGKYLGTVGDLQGAVEEYELAIRYAPDQPEIWQ
ncbi:MAG: hypothetical protein KDL10_06855, partial [Kiritimatiellae bacterium]|nr:hypothetical protein [Kiritimatiellia bacterium]